MRIDFTISEFLLVPMIIYHPLIFIDTPTSGLKESQHFSKLSWFKKAPVNQLREKKEALTYPVCESDCDVSPAWNSSCTAMRGHEVNCRSIVYDIEAKISLMSEQQ